MRHIHKYVFQDVYAWAGEFRSVPLARGNSFFRSTRQDSHLALLEPTGLLNSRRLQLLLNGSLSECISVPPFGPIPEPAAHIASRDKANGSRQKVYEVFAIRLGDGENNETNRQLSSFIRVCKGRSPSYELLAFNGYQIYLGRRE